ncbi:MAG TPA: hypothetical protein VJ779_20095 [Acetobacteraceae bacterium]|nr:hypothetical protein [Acetobacteraceae bacterium]
MHLAGAMLSAGFFVAVMSLVTAPELSLRQKVASVLLAAVVFGALGALIVWHQSALMAQKQGGDFAPARSPLELFEEDCANAPRLSEETTFTFAADNSQKAAKHMIRVQVCQDPYLYSKDYSFYVPKSPEDAQIIMELPVRYKGIVEALENKYPEQSWAMSGESGVRSSELRFSGEIHVYHEQKFSLETIEAFKRAFKASRLDAKFIGPS